MGIDNDTKNIGGSCGFEGSKGRPVYRSGSGYRISQ